MIYIDIEIIAILWVRPDVSKICNDDVSWDGNVLGLTYELKGDTAKTSRNKEELDPKQLLPLLSDPKRFVAAHILLCEKLSRSGETSSKSYSGLRVKLLEGGKVEYDDNDRLRLLKYWKQRIEQSQE